MAIANNKMNAQMRQTIESQSKKWQPMGTSWRKRGASFSGNPSGSEMVNFESASFGVIEKDRRRGADLRIWPNILCM